jgi:hypothetical protein
MVRVGAETDADDVLVSAFAGDNGKATVVILNRSTKLRRLNVLWPGATFTEMELVGPYHENDIRKAPAARAGGLTEVTIAPGALVTLTNVSLGSIESN